MTIICFIYEIVGWETLVACFLFLLHISLLHVSPYNCFFICPLGITNRSAISASHSFLVRYRLHLRQTNISILYQCVNVERSATLVIEFKPRYGNVGTKSAQRLFVLYYIHIYFYQIFRASCIPQRNITCFIACQIHNAQIVNTARCMNTSNKSGTELTSLNNKKTLSQQEKLWLYSFRYEMHFIYWFLIRIIA